MFKLNARQRRLIIHSYMLAMTIGGSLHLLFIMLGAILHKNLLALSPLTLFGLDQLLPSIENTPLTITLTLTGFLLVILVARHFLERRQVKIESAIE